MKSTELLPTKENLITTLFKDPIGRSADVFRFVEMLNCLEGCFCISLDSKWGSGKTFFVRQTQMVLDAFNTYCRSNLTDSEADAIKALTTRFLDTKTDIQPQVTVYYDAWANDNTSDPIVSLVYEITKSIGIDFKLQEDKGFERIADIASSIISFVTGRDANSLVEALKSGDLLNAIKGQNSLHDAICQFLETITEERGNRLTIFIDELDRCKPDYAVQLLERIKHYFSGERITFVFSINGGALQHTIRNYYGSEFDATRYLDRFFDLSFSLPPVDMAKYLIFIEAERGTGVLNDIRKRIIDYYHFEMREVMRYYKLTNIAVGKQATRNYSGWPEGYALDFCRIILIPIALALKTVNHAQYLAFIEGRDSSPLTNIVNGEFAHGFLQLLLTPNESFEVMENATINIVTLKDKLIEAYNALFSFSQSQYGGREVTVGRLEFSIATLFQFRRILSVVSSEADYN